MIFPWKFNRGIEVTCPLFTDVTLPNSAVWSDLEHYGDGIFVASGSAQATSIPTIIYTDDYGVTWQNASGASTQQLSWINLAKLGVRILAVSLTNSGTVVKYQSSTDGINWSGGNLTGIASQSDTPPAYTGLIADEVNGRYVMLLTVNNNAFGGTYIYSSDDDTGVAWTRHNVLPSNRRWQSIACNGESIVTVGVNLDSTDANYAAYQSIAGGSYRTNTWTAATLPSNRSWYHVIWTGTCFFATARFTAHGARSYDGGATWEAVTLPTGLNNNPMSCNPATGKLYCLIPDPVATPDYYYTSVDDGTTWSEQCSITGAAWARLATDGRNHVLITNGNPSNWTDKAGYHLA